MPSFKVFITTFNRSATLLSLLAEIKAQRGNLDVSLSIYDDCSTADYSAIRTFVSENPWVAYRRCSENHGKYGFWKTYNAMFTEAEWCIPADYYVFMPDDVEICRDFFGNIDRHWRGIDDPKKAALNLLFEKRCLGVQWTGIKGAKKKYSSVDVYRTGWVDCIFACPRNSLSFLGYHLIQPAADRWAKYVGISSGVGQQISKRLVDAGYSIYSVAWSFLHIIPGPSVMHPSERCKSPIEDINFDAQTSRAADKITASLASIPSRENDLRLVVDSLINQVDRLNVYLNDYDHVPDFLHLDKITVARSQDHGNLGDAGKFYWCEEVKGYHLTADDDIVYPLDYVSSMIDKVESYGRRAVVSVHGSVIVEPFVRYFKSRLLIHCTAVLETDRFAHIVGTGVLCYHTDTVKVHRSDFELPNMADVWFSLVAKKQGVPAVVMAHQKGWLGILDAPDSLYARYKNDDKAQSQAIAASGPWPDLGSFCFVQGHIMRGSSQHDHVFHQMKTSGKFYESPLLDFVKSKNLSGAYFDVGAHIGNHSVFFACQCDSDKVVSVEPYRPLAEILAENVNRNAPGKVVVVEAAAVARKVASVYYAAGSMQNTGMGKVSVEHTNISVATTTVDELCGLYLGASRLAVIKADVEGHEMDVLQGGMASIRRHRPLVIAECITDDSRNRINTLLRQYGYTQVGKFGATPCYVWEPKQR